MSPVQKLLYMGKRGMGALEFRPAIRATARERQSLEIADLVEQARRLSADNPKSHERGNRAPAIHAYGYDAPPVTAEKP